VAHSVFDVVSKDPEKQHIAKEVRKVEEELLRIEKKLANPDFLAKAKEEVIQKERGKASQYEEKMRTLKLSLERIHEIQEGGS